MNLLKCGQIWWPMRSWRQMQRGGHGERTIACNRSRSARSKGVFRAQDRSILVGGWHSCRSGFLALWVVATFHHCLALFCWLKSLRQWDVFVGVRFEHKRQSALPLFSKGVDVVLF